MQCFITFFSPCLSPTILLSLSPSPAKEHGINTGPICSHTSGSSFSLLAGINHKYFIIHHGRLSQGRHNLSALPSLAAQHRSNKLSSLLNKIDTVCKFRYWEFLHRPLLHSDRLGEVKEKRVGGRRRRERARDGAVGKSGWVLTAVRVYLHSPCPSLK